MKLGRIKGVNARAIKFAIYQSLMRALTKAVAKTMAKMLIILPESIFRKPPYPKSYNSQLLMKSAIFFLKQSLNDLKKKGFRVGVTRHNITLSFPAEYTEHVTEMRGVKWSKKSTEEDFVRITQQFFLQSIREEIHLATVRFQGEEVSINKFVSKVEA